MATTSCDSPHRFYGRFVQTRRDRIRIPQAFSFPAARTALSKRRLLGDIAPLGPVTPVRSMLLRDFRAERPSGSTHRLGARNQMSSCGNQEVYGFCSAESHPPYWTERCLITPLFVRIQVSWCRCPVNAIPPLRSTPRQRSLDGFKSRIPAGTALDRQQQ